MHGAVARGRAGAARKRFRRWKSSQNDARTKAAWVKKRVYHMFGGQKTKEIRWIVVGFALRVRARARRRDRFSRTWRSAPHLGPRLGPSAGAPFRLPRRPNGPPAFSGFLASRLEGAYACGRCFCCCLAAVWALRLGRRGLWAIGAGGPRCCCRPSCFSVTAGGVYIGCI